jgi:hypothetical protein
MMSAKQKSIFLSHSSKDKALADKVADLLTSGCAVNPNDILCTTLEGKGIPAGTPSFIEYLRQQIQEPKLVILLLSENFFASQFCLCELGAVWGMGLTNFPLVVPPMDKGKLKATLAVAQAGEVNSTAYLDELRDLVLHTVGASVPTPTWNVKRDAFLHGLDEVLKALPGLTNVPVEKLKEAQEKYQAALDEIGIKEKEARGLKDKIVDLEKCKDKDEVNAVARKYSSADEEFGRVCDAAKSAVSKLQHATRVAFYWKLRGDEGFEPEDADDREAVRTAESFEEIFSNSFFEASNAKIYKPDPAHPRVAKAEKALQELQNFLNDPKDKEFVKRFEDEYQFPASLGNRDFWRKFLTYV